jgi:hypothetical protein
MPRLKYFHFQVGCVWFNKLTIQMFFLGSHYFFSGRLAYSLSEPLPSNAVTSSLYTILYTLPRHRVSLYNVSVWISIHKRVCIAQKLRRNTTTWLDRKRGVSEVPIWRTKCTCHVTNRGLFRYSNEYSGNGRCAQVHACLHCDLGQEKWAGTLFKNWHRENRIENIVHVTSALFLYFSLICGMGHRAKKKNHEML